MKKRWEITPPLTKDERHTAKLLAGELKCPLVISEFLFKKEFLDNERIEQYFQPSLQMLHDPFLLRDMDKAVSRIINAIETGEKITIYGDYDVDGTTAVAVLYLGLKKLNAIIDFFIPHRTDDGYGLSISVLEQLHDKGTSLIVTVDCGTIAIDAVRAINEMGMQIIVTDHHNFKSELPEAFAIINPKLENEYYPFHDLAGVGVAYKLLMAIYERLGIASEENTLRYLDLVAVGTIADIVSLTDENRVIASIGLQQLALRKNIGLNALFEIAGIVSKPPDANDIIFSIAPRINAAGRMGSAMRAVELLISKNPDTCRELTEIIERENSLRQQIDTKTFSEACEMIDIKYKNISEIYCIVVSSEDWHQGVIGIIASKLIEKYYRPTIMISTHEGVGSGSGRSISDFDLFKALHDVSDVLESFGGHKYAVGLTILPEYIDIFEEKLSAYIKENIDTKHLSPPLKIDKKLEIYEITPMLMDWLDRFAPFGTNNPIPVFYTQRVMVQGYPYLVGKNHLKLKITKDGCELDLIGFNLGDYLSLIKNNCYLDIVYTLERVHWQGNTFIQGNLKDLHLHE
jgi:single-stranded-DNA-specific exonuclease